LYKTEIRQMAKVLNIPASIIDKPPSADLWAGQTDEGEIGVTYDRIDAMLVQLVDQGKRAIDELKAGGFPDSEIRRVVSMINRNAFKRELPEIADLDRRPIPRNISMRA